MPSEQCSAAAPKVVPFWFNDISLSLSLFSLSLLQYYSQQDVLATFDEDKSGTVDTSELAIGGGPVVQIQKLNSSIV